MAEYSSEEKRFVEFVWERSHDTPLSEASSHQRYVVALKACEQVLGPRSGELGACRPASDGLAQALLMCSLMCLQDGTPSEQQISRLFIQLYEYIYAAYCSNQRHAANLIQSRRGSRFLGALEIPAWMLEAFAVRARRAKEQERKESARHQ